MGNKYRNLGTSRYKHINLNFMNTKKTSYATQIAMLLLIAFTFFNCAVESLEDETKTEEANKFIEPGTGVVVPGGTDDGDDGGDGDNDDNGDGDFDGDGDPSTTDPNDNDPCTFTPGSNPDPSNWVWANADCDGDGIPNGIDSTPMGGFN